MSKQVQLRGGTTAQHNTFTGASREVTVDTDKHTLVVHDGLTAGGFPMASITSPVLSGTPTVPTAPEGTNTTQIATTAFVLANSTPLPPSKKGIFGYGGCAYTYNLSITNLVSNTGVVSSDTTGVGTARTQLSACSYGTDKGIFGYGLSGENYTQWSYLSMTNLVSNTGVVSSDTTGVGTTRAGSAACSYGEDKGIFGYGWNPPPGSWGIGYESVTNKVSNTGVVSSNTAGVGTARSGLAACSYSK